MGKAIDLTGQTFGRLKVLERVENKISPNGHSKVMWKCLCECGNIIESISQSIRRGMTTSCGCYNKEVVSNIKLHNLIGKRFGRLTVIERDLNFKSLEGVPKWICKCDCGKTVSVLAKSLIRKSTKSCGCLRKDLLFKDLTGGVYGQLTVIKFEHSGKQGINF